MPLWGVGRRSYLEGLGGAEPEAEGKDRHSLLPICCCWTRMTPQEAFVLYPSLYPQGEGSVQAGGNGEDFCQVSASTRGSSGFDELRWCIAVARICCLLWRLGWVMSWPWQPAFTPACLASRQCDSIAARSPAES